MGDGVDSNEREDLQSRLRLARSVFWGDTVGVSLGLSSVIYAVAYMMGVF